MLLIIPKKILYFCFPVPIVNWPVSQGDGNKNKCLDLNDVNNQIYLVPYKLLLNPLFELIV